MALPTRPTVAERSRTVTLRVNRNTRTAEFDGVRSIYYGDTLIVVVDNIVGVTAADLELWLWEKAANPAITDRLAYATGFTSPTGSSSTASLEVAFDSTNLRDALVASPIGTPVTMRLIVRESNMPIIDMDVPVYPNPHINADPAPDPDDIAANPYVRRDHLRQWALDALNPLAVGYLPLETPDDMAAAITAILTKLSDVTA